MVFLTQICLKYMPWWLKRPNPKSRWFRHHEVLKNTAYVYGRGRNCYRIAIRSFRRNMGKEALAHKNKMQWFQQLHSQRILAACVEHDWTYEQMMGMLPRVGIELSRKTLADLACLVDITKAKFVEEDECDQSERLPYPEGVVSRKLL